MSSSVRQQRVAELIREDMSRMILFEMDDPRLHGVTVTRAEVSADLKYARVYVSIMGTDEEQRIALSAMKNARGLLRQKLARVTHLRSVPQLRFVKDESVKKGFEFAQKLRQIEEELAARSGEQKDVETNSVAVENNGE